MVAIRKQGCLPLPLPANLADCAMEYVRAIIERNGRLRSMSIGTVTEVRERVITLCFVMDRSPVLQEDVDNVEYLRNWARGGSGDSSFGLLEFPSSKIFSTNDGYAYTAALCMVAHMDLASSAAAAGAAAAAGGNATASIPFLLRGMMEIRERNIGAGGVLATTTTTTTVAGEGNQQQLLLQARENLLACETMKRIRFHVNGMAEFMDAGTSFVVHMIQGCEGSLHLPGCTIVGRVRAWLVATMKAGSRDAGSLLHLVSDDVLNMIVDDTMNMWLEELKGFLLL